MTKFKLKKARKPGIRAGLTPSRIVEKAMSVMEKTGATFSIPKLAKALNVKPATIYFHFPDGPPQLKARVAEYALETICPSLKEANSADAYFQSLTAAVLKFRRDNSEAARLVADQLSRNDLLFAPLPDDILAAIDLMNVHEIYRIVALKIAINTLLGHLTAGDEFGWEGDEPKRTEAYKHQIGYVIDEAESPLLNIILVKAISAPPLSDAAKERRERVRGRAIANSLIETLKALRDRR